MSTKDMTLNAVRFAWILSTLTSVFSQDSPLKTCLSVEDRNRTVNITLTCAPGMVISLGEAFFGRNQWGLCAYTAGDCTKNIDSFDVCDGVRKCTRSFSGTYTPKCDYATFLTVIYDCVVESDVSSTTQILDVRTNAPTTPRHVWISNWEPPIVTPRNNDDTALIAGCVVAIVITVIVLVLAIVLVIRRLIGVRQDASPSPKKRSGLALFICTKLGCAVFQRRAPDPETGNALPATSSDQDQEEGRLTPDGAAAVEEVQELGQTTSDDQETQERTRNNLNESFTIEQTTASNAREMHVSNHGTSGVGDSEDMPSAQGQEADQSLRSSQHRTDSVATPNPELSTLF